MKTSNPSLKRNPPSPYFLGTVKIPSEILEPIVTQTLGELMEGFALGSYTYKEMDDRIKGLSHFVDNCGAIHCSLAITNFQGMIWGFENRSEELRAMFKSTLEKHYA